MGGKLHTGAGDVIERHWFNEIAPVGKNVMPRIIRDDAETTVFKCSGYRPFHHFPLRGYARMLTAVLRTCW
jgi:hypothetical protein